jgi:hypothetical protein
MEAEDGEIKSRRKGRNRHGPEREKEDSSAKRLNPHGKTVFAY